MIAMQEMTKLKINLTGLSKKLCQFRKIVVKLVLKVLVMFYKSRLTMLVSSLVKIQRLLDFQLGMLN